MEENVFSLGQCWNKYVSVVYKVFHPLRPKVITPISQLLQQQQEKNTPQIS